MKHFRVFLVSSKRTCVEYKYLDEQQFVCNVLVSCVTVYLMVLWDVRGQALFQKNQTLDKL